MEILTADQAHSRIIETLDLFAILAQKQQKKLYATISNVRFVDLVMLYYRLGQCDKRFYMPGEIDNDNMCFIFRPCLDCIIMIESEKPGRGAFKKGINLINMN